MMDKQEEKQGNLEVIITKLSTLQTTLFVLANNLDEVIEKTKNGKLLNILSYNQDNINGVSLFLDDIKDAIFELVANDSDEDDNNDEDEDNDKDNKIPDKI